MTAPQLAPECPWRSAHSHVAIDEDDGPGYMSSSLPQPTREEMTHLQAKYIDAILTPGEGSKSVPEVSPCHDMTQPRPRSASVCSPPSNKKRRPSFTLSRSRPSSGKSKTDSATDKKAISTNVVDNVLLSVKGQLAKLSEEDLTLQERMDRLTEDIAILQKQRYMLATSVGKETPALDGDPKKSTPNPTIPVLVVTDSMSSLKLTQTWKDKYINQADIQATGLQPQGDIITLSALLEQT